ncbi:MAG TPA: hypothetical protein VFI25_11945 [Planctomycetota bacterium]|jgi:hypothetical protein|nr:hypothetical protein [Planctomycetota bacterium]
MRVTLGLLAAAVLVLGSPPAASQGVVIHEERVWLGPPCPMGDYDEQAVANVTGSYTGPVNPAGFCELVPPAPGGPFGAPGATLWHTEIDCCALGAGPPPGWGPTFAAYNTGAGPAPPAPFTYITLNAAGTSVANAGAICSYGIDAVSMRPAGNQRIILCFEYVKTTETPGTPAFDTSFVEVRPAPCGEPCAVDPAGAPPWTAISVLAPPNVGCATPTICCIGPGNPALNGIFLAPPGAPGGGKIRFRFNSGDGTSNAYCGWAVDNVVLTNEECFPPCAAASPFQPRIATSGDPSPGAPITIGLLAGPPGAFAFLVIGIANPPPAAFGGCALCCAPLIILGPFGTSTAGTFSLPVVLPPLPPCFTEFCLQWVVLGGGGVFTSSAGKLVWQIG